LTVGIAKEGQKMIEKRLAKDKRIVGNYYFVYLCDDCTVLNPQEPGFSEFAYNTSHL
jgi:hypothetical protein